MFYLDTNTQKRYTIGRPFVYNGTQYTKAGASHNTFMSLGFTQVLLQARPDDAYYVVSGPDVTGAYSSTPRDLNDLKTNFKLQQKRQAHQTLRQSDWYVIRSMELGVVTAAVPVTLSNYRAAYRAASDARCAQIDACATVEQLKALMQAPGKILSNPQDVNSPMITNPAALFAWPEPLADTYDYL